jgi:hypothetical protein
MKKVRWLQIALFVLKLNRKYNNGQNQCSVLALGFVGYRGSGCISRSWGKNLGSRR